MCLARWIALAAAVAALDAGAQALQLHVSDILGREVRTPEGEVMPIRDLVIDTSTGKVAQFAVGRADEPERAAWRFYPLEALRSVAGGLVIAPTSPAFADAPASAGASVRAP